MILAAALVVLVTSNARSQLDVHLRTERSRRGMIPIVISAIGSEERDLRSLAREVTSVLRKDLEYTGVFEPIAASGALPRGETAAASFEGTVGRREPGYVLEMKLLDYSSREVIFSKRYSFRDNSKRIVAHTICDEIMYFLVGERGIARTRLLFCRKGAGAKDLYLIDYDGHGVKRLTNEELVVSPMWLDAERLCFTSYRRGNPDCYLADLRGGRRKLISHRKGLNVAGDYLPGRDEIVMTLSHRGNSEIYHVDCSGTILSRLTRNRAIDCSPSWSPNGREIVFVSDRTRTPQIYIMDRFGGNVRRLTRDGSYNTSPAWSPRGDLISYVSRDGPRYRLMLASPDGLVDEALFDDYLSYEDPCWAPDGRHIAATVRYGGKPWIVVIDTETGKKRRLVQGETAAWSLFPSRRKN